MERGQDVHVAKANRQRKCTESFGVMQVSQVNVVEQSISSLKGIIDMTTPDSTQTYRDQARTFFEQTAKKALETKFVQRSSPLDGSIFLQSLVMNVFRAGVIALDQLAQTAHRLNADIRISGQAFKERFNARSVEFLKALFAEALQMTLPQQSEVLALLSAFNEVNLLDSTTVTLPETLATEFPGCGGAGAKAAVKLYLVLNYLTGGYQQMRIEAGRKADQDMGERFLAEHKAGALWLFDLGFFNAPFLAQIARAATFFVCRLAASQTVFYCRRADGELEPFDLDQFLHRASCLKSKSSLAPSEKSRHD